MVVHLPLVVPEKCAYRVGFEHRAWKEGELLIFDVWNPLIDRQQREAVRTLASAARAFSSIR